MIDNVVLLLSGALQKKSVRDLLGRCHPLGRFSEMEAVNIAETPSDLFHAVLVETPLGTSVGEGSPVCGHCPGSREHSAVERLLGVGGPAQPACPAQTGSTAGTSGSAPGGSTHLQCPPPPHVHDRLPLPRAPSLPRHRRPHGLLRGVSGARGVRRPRSTEAPPARAHAWL